MSNSSTMQLEVCVENAAAGLSAVEAGATRIEINTALQLDGLTASSDDCRLFKAACDADLVAMVRPHARSFRYSPRELEQALHSCSELLAAGADGIVFGALDDGGLVDLGALAAVRQACGERPLIFHKAFDQVPDQFEALEQLIDHGVQRVLTSGAAATALLGVGQLRQLVERARGRIEILPGGGVSAQNAAAILQATGCNQLHGSFRSSSSVAGRADDVAIRQVREMLDSTRCSL